MNPVIYPRNVRFRWYLQVEKEQRSVKEVCAIFGIARKTYYKWYAHDHGQGPRAYRQDKRQPNLKLTPEVCSLIEREKRRTNYGPLKRQLLLKRRLDIDCSTTIIYRYYLRKKLIRRPQKRLPWYRPLTEPIIPGKPGELVEMDTKYVWMHGTRQYQRTFVDIYTGFQHAVVVGSLEAQDTITAFKETERLFPFTILGVQSDNGSENRGDFTTILGCEELLITLSPRTPPTGRARWNGPMG